MTIGISGLAPIRFNFSGYNSPGFNNVAKNALSSNFKSFYRKEDGIDFPANLYSKDISLKTKELSADDVCFF